MLGNLKTSGVEFSVVCTTLVLGRCEYAVSRERSVVNVCRWSCYAQDLSALCWPQARRTMPGRKHQYKCPQCSAGPYQWKLLTQHFQRSGHAGPEPYSAIQHLCVVKKPSKKSAWLKDKLKEKKERDKAAKRANKMFQQMTQVHANRASGSEGVVDTLNKEKAARERSSLWKFFRERQKARAKEKRTKKMVQQMLAVSSNRALGRSDGAADAVNKEQAAREQREATVVSEERTLRSHQRSIFNAFLVRIVDKSGGRMMIPSLARHCHNDAGESLDPRILEGHLARRPDLFALRDDVITLTKIADASIGTQPVGCNESAGCEVDDQDHDAAKFLRTSMWSERAIGDSSTRDHCHAHKPPELQPSSAPLPCPATDAKADSAKEITTTDTCTLDCAPGGTGEVARPEVRSTESTRFADWLMSLDNGGGAMLQYTDALLEQFEGDPTQLCSAWRGTCEGRSVVDSVDPYFWDGVGVHRLGHKYLFAHGIANLVRQAYA